MWWKMPTKNRLKPWPEWTADQYYRLRSLARRAIKTGEKAREIQHTNVYATARLLSMLIGCGQDICNTVRFLNLHKPSNERWPYWVNEALEKVYDGGRYIEAGGKHGLTGIDEDNWKMVLKGINTCLDHARKIEAALLTGPPPSPEFGLSEDLIKTLEMGETNKNSWRRRNK